MRKIKEVLRLIYEQRLSARQVARAASLSRSTVAAYRQRFEQTGLSWPDADGIDDATLERRLFPEAPSVSASERNHPDWAQVQQELRRKNVTLMLLWQEYKATQDDGYQYSWFCQHYRAWRGQLDLVMRQEHLAGEKLFVDYTGHTAEVIDRSTGEIRSAEIFVAVLGASNYTYAEATWSQQLPDWIGSHVRAFSFLGGVPEIVVPDNLKSGVVRADRYEPDLNPTYQDLARHYGVAVIPARSRKPRDKAKVEAGVLVVERWILARLRDRQFFSLAELNAAIAELLVKLNNRPFKKLPGSRQSQFEAIDRPVLKPLPAQPYEYAEWKKARVHIDYHVEIDGHYYSVPYQLSKQQLDVRLTRGTVECYHHSQRVASHARSYLKGRHTTVPEHMPKAHREYAEWTPQRLLAWAGKAGPATAAVIEQIMAQRLHPQQGFRSALGIMRLGKQYGDERLEAACTRAHQLGAFSRKSIESILRHGLDRQQLLIPINDNQTPIDDHEHIRGADYYN
jgi:transposase